MSQQRVSPSGRVYDQAAIPSVDTSFLYEPYEPRICHLHPLTCGRCGDRFLGPGSGPDDCPHARHGLCARCFQRRMHVQNEEAYVRYIRVLWQQKVIA